ncbi:hypothetical protein DAT36_08990 [Photobacterium phosphoreum]|uniref:Uncharacterized protein n=2 Tax=Photobacterium phosphoreum TaxID=659 RepID=A0A2T3JWC8_PHOPO|nr:hypothetical protein CTM96_03805 [Photobacterium phosphoreum]PSU43396.1 hypothetical protein CTM97_05135 [Photobacterium phosphoreum]PSU53632.1 hypothetical protein C9J18_04285 [Photobacterium phosphoreum]PSU66983.1 hypothetical protein CTM79_17695 [Photobacterium phosphoreum]PSW09106.1 hypothetical protein C9J20_16655 [Photobacterium phosphoreum]
MMMNQIKRLNFQIIPAQIFIFAFWIKNGFIDKFFGVTIAAFFPTEANKGDSWAGWESYITGNWNKSDLAHIIFTPAYNYLFPVIVLLQCLPAIIIAIAIIKGEFLHGKDQVFTQRAATASLFVTSVLLFSQTIAGAPDGQYLWQLLGLGMILIMYIKSINK